MSRLQGDGDRLQLRSLAPNPMPELQGNGKGQAMKYATLQINESESDVLIGLVTKEWGVIREDPDRLPYFETLDRLRRKLIDNQPLR